MKKALTLVIVVIVLLVAVAPAAAAQFSWLTPTTLDVQIEGAWYGSFSHQVTDFKGDCHTIALFGDFIKCDGPAVIEVMPSSLDRLVVGGQEIFVSQ